MIRAGSHRIHAPTALCELAAQMLECAATWYEVISIGPGTIRKYGITCRCCIADVDRELFWPFSAKPSALSNEI
jgi:hypothetical protein